MAGEEQYREKLKEMGAEIRARRESLGLSLEEVSDGTKIRAKYLRAVEAGDESPAPGRTYFGAFLKTYAVFLGLDGGKYSANYRELRDLRSSAQPSRGKPDKLSKAMPPTRGETPASEGDRGTARKRAAARRPGRRPRRSSRSALWVFLLMFAVAVVIFVVVRYQQATRVAEPEPVAEVPMTPVVPPAVPPDEPPAPETPVPVIERKDPDSGTTVFTINETPLELTVRTAGNPDSYCWLRVSLDGKVALEKTLSPNNEEKFSAKSSIEIRAGKPWEITLTLNGQDIGVGGIFGPVKDITIRSVQVSSPS